MVEVVVSQSAVGGRQSGEPSEPPERTLAKRARRAASGVPEAASGSRQTACGGGAVLSSGRFEPQNPLPMPLDPELLAILVCPHCRGALARVELPENVRRTLVERYREHFRDETPVVEEGLFCGASQLVFPIVSDIPVMLVDEALPASVLAR